MTIPNATSFVVYRWANPQTTSDYPFLAVAQDRSALLSLGDYGVTLDWGIPDEATAWLARDFVATGELLVCDLGKMRSALAALFSEDAEFASVRFGAELLPRELQLVLSSQEAADEEPEYLIQAVGRYFRVERDPDMQCPVDPEEHAMLDVCAATFAELAAHYKSEDHRTAATSVSQLVGAQARRLELVPSKRRLQHGLSTKHRRFHR